MDITYVSVTYPLWFTFAILATLVWPLLGLFLRRRGCDLRLFTLMPFSLNIVACAVGVRNVVTTASITGPAPHATAAGLAEALFPLGLGTAVATTISLVLFVKPRWRSVSSSDVPRLLFALNCLAFVAVFSLAIYVRLHPAYSLPVDRVSLAVAVGALLIFLISVVTTFLSRGASVDEASRWFAVFGVVQLFAAVATFAAVNWLRLYAMGSV